SSHEEMVPSRVVLLADTSLSMNLPSDLRGGDRETRGSQLTALVTDSSLLEQLAESHEVDLVAFGETTRPLAHLTQRRSSDPQGGSTEGPDPPVAFDLDRDKLTTELIPSGRATHWGDALAETLERYRGLPLAAVIVLSDGGQNQGL